MIKIDFVEPTNREWREWVDDCIAEQLSHDAQILAGRPIQAKSQLYGRLKKTVYLDPNGPFFGKCAFCEDSIRTNQHGDIEHFRPKGAIVDQGTGKRIMRPASMEPHPGYYWLAYDWRNFLPACQLCNQPSSEPGGEKLGKRNYFPLANEATRAQAKGEEVHEEPLLINPTQEDPDCYLGVDGRTGVMFARQESIRGETCIHTFGLNLRDLPKQRLDAYDNARLLYKAWFDARLSGSADLQQLDLKYRRILRGDERFAAAARIGISDSRQEMLAIINQST
jgi:hypothetical protein